MICLAKGLVASQGQPFETVLRPPSRENPKKNLRPNSMGSSVRLKIGSYKAKPKKKIGVASEIYGPSALDMVSPILGPEMAID